MVRRALLSRINGPTDPGHRATGSMTRGISVKRMMVVAVAAASMLTLVGCSSDSGTAVAPTSAASSSVAKPATSSAPDPAGTKQACADSEAAFNELAGKQDELKAEAAKENYEAIQLYYQGFATRMRKDAALAGNPVVRDGLELLAKKADAIVNATTTDELKVAMVDFGTLAQGTALDSVAAACG